MQAHSTVAVLSCQREPDKAPTREVDAPSHQSRSLGSPIAKFLNVRRAAIGSCCPPGESMRFQPVIELIDPKVAAGALFSHAEAMASGAENVDRVRNVRVLKCENKRLTYPIQVGHRISAQT